MTLTLRDGTHARDGTASGMNTNFAAVEHADAENVAVLAGAGADDLGESTETNDHQLAALALLRLFFAQPFIAHRFRRRRGRGGGGAAGGRPAGRAGGR